MLACKLPADRPGDLLISFLEAEQAVLDLRERSEVIGRQHLLTAKAESVGYHPQVILAGRRINNGMGKFVAEQTVKLLSRLERSMKDLRVAVLGLTFKENVPDLR